MTDRVKHVDVETIGLPLPRPINVGAATITSREYATVRVETTSGLVGKAYCLTRGAPIDVCVQRLIAPYVLGVDSEDVSGTWERCFRGNVMLGRSGIVMHSLGLIDVALWDVASRRAGVPLHRLLGREATQVPVMMVAAYPVAGRSVDDLVADVVFYAERGYRLLKIARSADQDLTRLWIRQLCAALPDTSKVVVDAAYEWRNADEALAEIATWGSDVDLAWLEDPLVPEDAADIARIRRESSHLVGIGDGVSNSATYDALLSAGAADILRLDVIGIGGVTPALRVLETAAQARIPVSFHVYPELSVHLATGVDGAVIETFDPQIAGGNPFDPAHRLLSENLEVTQGLASPPAGAGLGYEFVDPVL